MTLTAEQRHRARQLAHNLVHRDGLSIRQAQKVMRESYALRRSVGSIMRDLALWECSRCQDRPGRAAQDQPTVPARVHQGVGGSLTRQVTDGG